MTTKEEVKANKKQANAPLRHRRVELAKTIAITVLITAIVSFLGGMHVANANNADKQKAVQAALKG